MHDAGGDGVTEADAHRPVGAGVEAGTGAEARQLGEADIHRAGALGAEDRVLWHPGGDVAQGPEIIGRRLVIVDLGPDLRLHPTVKPSALVADAIQDVTRRGDLVLDLFLGSGTTLVAAERVGRRFRGLDIDPAYVDVAIARWTNMTGGAPERAEGSAA